MGKKDVHAALLSPGMSYGVIWEKRTETSWGRGLAVNIWGQHVSGSTSEWTCLFLDNVLPLENAWLPWQLPFRWHSWSPPLTATIRSRSSTPKHPGRDLVSIFPQVISPCTGKRAQEGTLCRQGAVARSTAAWHALRDQRSGLDMLHVSSLLGKWAWASPLLLLDFGFLCKMRNLKPQVLLSALGLLLLPPGDVMTCSGVSPASAEGQIYTNNLITLFMSKERLFPRTMTTHSPSAWRIKQENTRGKCNYTRTEHCSKF